MKTLLITLALVLPNYAAAQEPVMVDPHDFTRTPCEYRRAPCPGISPQPASITRNTVLESEQITVLFASGETIDATVSLVAISDGARDATIEKRVIVLYESVFRKLRSRQTREAVYFRLASMARGYGVKRTDVAACRPASQDCQVSSFERDDALADD